MKKYFSKMLSLFIVLMLLTTLFTGCGSNKQMSGDLGIDSEMNDFVSDDIGGIKGDYGVSDDNLNAPESGLPDINSTDKSDATGSGRKIIETISMRIETKEFAELVDMIEQQVNKTNGYIAESSVDGSSYSGNKNRSARMVLRIPAEKSDSFVDFISGNSIVTQKSVDTDDVTSDYIDIESRLKALELERTALEELMEKAATVDEIIYVREKLTDVIYKIESVESQLRSYDNRIAYTTITMNIYEVETPTIVVKQTVWEEIATKFSTNISEIKDNVVAFFVFVISESPYLLLYAACIVVAVAIISHVMKKKNVLKNADNSQQCAATDGVVTEENASTEENMDVSGENPSSESLNLDDK